MILVRMQATLAKIGIVYSELVGEPEEGDAGQHRDAIVQLEERAPRLQDREPDEPEPTCPG